ncbi:uncharacterized protein LOC134543165 [Bacillus rossius redtenbacheri]|uniref:uncharacterized protein LOC134543165 n=1 Tax=Bacillus rossius redtenbacheri TaxID=93214 RepID=UPI002FDE0081
MVTGPACCDKDSFLEGRAPPLSPRGDLEDALFDFCSGCYEFRMASIPQGAYAAKKIRACIDNKTMSVSNMKASEKSSSHQYFAYAKKDFEYLPAKYNGKMMNSIWGLYNRYSVHNMKKITDGDSSTVQQWSSLSAVTLAPPS